MFRPNNGVFLKGEVSIHSPSHLSLVIWNIFSASVERKRLPRGWQWHEREMDTEQLDQLTRKAEEDGIPKWKQKKFIRQGLGAWVDANGQRVEGELTFRALDFDVTMDRDGEASMLSVEASLVSEERDGEIDATI